MAGIEQLDLEQIKYPKATNTLVKNDFLHRIHTLDLMIAYDKWIDTAGYNKLFFDVYFDTNGSQRDQKNGALRSKTRIEMGNQGFIDPDGIFAFEQQDMCRIFVLEMANGFDTKRIVEQIKKNLMASYNGLVGDKYGLPHTATLLVVVEYDTMLKNVLHRIKEELFFQKFNGLERYLFLGFHQTLMDSWASSWFDVNGNLAPIFL